MRIHIHVCMCVLFGCRGAISVNAAVSWWLTTAA